MSTIVPCRTQEDRQVMVKWLAMQIGVTVAELCGTVPYEVVCVAKRGFPVGAIMYLNYRVTSIEMSCAGLPGWLSRGMLRGAFQYPFVQLGCYTVITGVRRGNTIARRFNEALGFETLGAIESGQGRSEDTIIYTMSRPKCRWLTAADHAAAIAPAIAPAINGDIRNVWQRTESA